MKEFAILQNADQHWKGGDAHGNAHNECERGKGGACLRIFIVERQRQDYPEKIRYKNAGVTNH